MKKYLLIILIVSYSVVLAGNLNIDIMIDANRHMKPFLQKTEEILINDLVSNDSLFTIGIGSFSDTCSGFNIMQQKLISSYNSALPLYSAIASLERMKLKGNANYLKTLDWLLAQRKEESLFLVFCTSNSDTNHTLNFKSIQKLNRSLPFAYKSNPLIFVVFNNYQSPVFYFVNSNGIDSLSSLSKAIDRYKQIYITVDEVTENLSKVSDTTSTSDVPSDFTSTYIIIGIILLTCITIGIFVVKKITARRIKKEVTKDNYSPQNDLNIEQRHNYPKQPLNNHSNKRRIIYYEAINQNTFESKTGNFILLDYPVNLIGKSKDCIIKNINNEADDVDLSEYNSTNPTAWLTIKSKLDTFSIQANSLKDDASIMLQNGAGKQLLLTKQRPICESNFSSLPLVIYFNEVKIKLSLTEHNLIQKFKNVNEEGNNHENNFS